jgi:hypothetical protein
MCRQSGACFIRSPIFVWVSPDVRRYLELCRQLDHVHRWLVAARSARTATERSFKFPDRRIARPANGIKRDAGAGLTAVAFDFHPTIAAVKTLADRRRWLRWPAIALSARIRAPRWRRRRLFGAIWYPMAGHLIDLAIWFAFGNPLHHAN